MTADLGIPQFRFLACISLFALIFTAERAFAQETTVSWSAAVFEAKQSNAAVQSAQSLVKSAHAQSWSAASGFFPQVSASVGTSTSAVDVKNPGIGGAFSQNADNTFSASVSGTQNLFSGLQTLSGFRQAQAFERSAQADLRTVEAQLNFDLKSAYALLLYAQNAVTLSEEIIKRRHDNLRIVELRFENGNENKGSVLLSQAYLNDAELNLLQSTNGIITSRQLLAQVLGRDQEQPFVVRDEVPISPVPVQVAFDDLAKRTPEYERVIAQEEAAKAGVRLARAPFFPSLDLAANAGRLGQHFFPDDTQLWTVGVSLTLPIFNGGRDLHNTQAAMASASAALANKENTYRDRLSKLKAAYAAYQESVGRLKVDQSFLEAAVVREKIGTKKYNNGLLSFEDWDIIENDLIARQKAVIQSARERVTQEAAWEQAQGIGP